MSVNLNSLVFGDPGVGKSSAIKLLSTGRRYNQKYAAAVYDQATRKQLMFIFHECMQMPSDTNEVICALIFYNIWDRDTFNSVRQYWMPEITSKLQAGTTFIMLIGTHSDMTDRRQVSVDEAEEFASENSAFHMEISCILNKNIELTLKLMKIRSLHILKKNPFMKDTDLVNLSSPKMLVDSRSCTSLREIQIEEPPSDEIKSNTPQFSGKGIKIHSFDMENDFLPPPTRPFTTRPTTSHTRDTVAASFNRFQLQKHMREESLSEIPGEMAATFDKKKIRQVEGIQSVSRALPSPLSRAALPSPQSNPQIIDYSPQLRFPEESGIKHAIPRLPKLPKVPSGSSTERRTQAPYALAARNTERQGREALLFLNCTLSPGDTRKIGVYDGDTAWDVAERLDLTATTQELAAMAEKIEIRINKWIQEVTRSTQPEIIGRCRVELDRDQTEDLFISRGDSPDDLAKDFWDEHGLGETWQNRISDVVQEEYGQDLERIMLFKVNIGLPDGNHEIKVRKGDRLEVLAQEFAMQHDLGDKLQMQILQILNDASRGADL